MTRNKRVTCNECGERVWFLVSGDTDDEMIVYLNSKLTVAGWLIGNGRTYCCPNCAKEVSAEPTP